MQSHSEVIFVDYENVGSIEMSMIQKKALIVVASKSPQQLKIMHNGDFELSGLIFINTKSDTKNASDFLISAKIGELHMALDKQIPFKILSNDRGFTPLTTLYHDREITLVSTIKPKSASPTDKVAPETPKTIAKAKHNGIQPADLEPTLLKLIKNFNQMKDYKKFEAKGLMKNIGKHENAGQVEAILAGFVDYLVRSFIVTTTPKNPAPGSIIQYKKQKPVTDERLEKIKNFILHRTPKPQ